MSLGLAFWVVMLIWLVVGIWAYRADPARQGLILGVNSILLFILLLLLGWAEFGPALHR